MEKSIEYGFEHYIAEIPGMHQTDPKAASPLVLAYIGDCVFDLIIKLMVTGKGNRGGIGRYTSCMKRQVIMCRHLPSHL